MAVAEIAEAINAGGTLKELPEGTLLHTAPKILILFPPPTVLTGGPFLSSDLLGTIFQHFPPFFSGV